MSYDRKEYRRDRFERKQAYHKQEGHSKKMQGKMPLEELERMEDEVEMEIGEAGDWMSDDVMEESSNFDGELDGDDTNETNQEDTDGQAKEGK